MSKFALILYPFHLKYARVVRPEGYSSAETVWGEERHGGKMRNTSPKKPTQSINSLHFCQIVHAEKDKDWEMSRFWLWEHQGEILPNFHLKLLEFLLFFICLSSLLRENSDKNISFNPVWLRGEKVVFSFQFVSTLLTTCQNIQQTKNTLQILHY